MYVCCHFLAKDALIQTVVTDWLRSFPAGQWREADDRGQRPDDGDHSHCSASGPELRVAHGLGDGTVAVDADQNEVQDGRGTEKNVGGQPQVAQHATERPVAEQLIGE